MFGDFLAFIAALLFVVYLTAGRILREWLPVFMYVGEVVHTSDWGRCHPSFRGDIL